MAIDLSWHAPAQTLINNLTNVVSAQGVYGFIYNTSTTPDEQYGTYNWCNMPHVRKTEYVKPPADYALQYVELVSTLCVDRRYGLTPVSPRSTGTTREHPTHPMRSQLSPTSGTATTKASSTTANLSLADENLLHPTGRASSRPSTPSSPQAGLAPVSSPKSQPPA
jgi:hypothetical protein